MFIMPGTIGYKRFVEDGSNWDARTRWKRSSFRAGHGSSLSLIQKGNCCIVISLCMIDHRRTAFVQTDDVDQSVRCSIRFDLVADK